MFLLLSFIRYANEILKSAPESFLSKKFKNIKMEMDDTYFKEIEKNFFLYQKNITDNEAKMAYAILSYYIGNTFYQNHDSDYIKAICTYILDMKIETDESITLALTLINPSIYNTITDIMINQKHINIFTLFDAVLLNSNYSSQNISQKLKTKYYNGGNNLFSNKDTLKTIYQKLQNLSSLEDKRVLDKLLLIMTKEDYKSRQNLAEILINIGKENAPTEQKKEKCLKIIDHFENIKKTYIKKNTKYINLNKHSITRLQNQVNKQSLDITLKAMFNLSIDAIRDGTIQDIYYEKIPSLDYNIIALYTIITNKYGHLYLKNDYQIIKAIPEVLIKNNISPYKLENYLNIFLNGEILSIVEKAYTHHLITPNILYNEIINLHNLNNLSLILDALNKYITSHKLYIFNHNYNFFNIASSLQKFLGDTSAAQTILSFCTINNKIIQEKIQKDFERVESQDIPLPEKLENCLTIIQRYSYDLTLKK